MKLDGLKMLLFVFDTNLFIYDLFMIHISNVAQLQNDSRWQAELKSNRIKKKENGDPVETNIHQHLKNPSK